MAWADDLQQATFRGVVFDCQTIGDSAQRDVAQHAAPYRDGADIEDLGRSARTMRVRAIFWGADYLTRLNGFIQALDTPGAGELIHPVFGSIPDAQPVDISIDHDADAVDQCTVSVTFLESVSGVSLFNGATTTQDAAAIESAADDAMDAATDVLSDQLGEITGLGDLPEFDVAALSLPDLPAAVLGPGFDVSRITSVRAAMSGVTAALRALPGLPATVLANLDPALNPRAWASDLAAMTGEMIGSRLEINGLLTATAQALNLPNTLIVGDLSGLRSIARNVTAVLGAGARLADGGVLSAAQRVVAGFAGLASMFALPVRVVPYASAAPVVSAGLPLTLSQAARNGNDTHVVALHVQTELSASLAVAARTVMESDAIAAVLTPAELESVANTTRAALEACIERWRVTYPAETARPVIERLRNVALLVQASAQSLIALRPPLVIRALTAPANMRLLAHRLYGDHTRAPELMRLNQYGREPLLEVGVKVRTYAA